MSKLEINDLVGGRPWTQSLDGQAWAKEFIQRVHKRPEIATDEGTMIGWFANAIMVGYDRAQQELSVLPKINIRCECSDGVVHGSTYLNVVRVEQEDDGSFTVVTDHWPNV